MRRILYVLIICLVLPVFFGCGQKDPGIAFFVYDEDDTFISEMMDYMTARTADNLHTEVRYAGNSQSVQNQQIVELTGEGYDLFVINAVDRQACSSIVEKCAGKDIPVVFFNREPLEGSLVGGSMYYVGAAADSLGKKQADMAASLFGGGYPYDRNGDGIVQLVILKGEQGHQDAEKRTDNCVSRLKELGYTVDVLVIEVADWKRENAYNSMRQLYNKYGDQIELVFANNDDMALGAIDFLLEEGVFSESEGEYDQPFAIIGVDGTSVGLEAIGKGLLYGTANNDFKKQSDAILKLIEYITVGKDFKDFPYAVTNESYIYIDGDIITRDNLQEYINLGT